MTRSGLRQALARAYLTIDPRSLGLGRIALGAVLMIDLLRRVPLMRDFYTNAGLLPNHTVLWRPPLPRLFSVFFPVSLQHEAVIAFVLCGFCFLCFLIGWRTRLFHVLSFLLVTSLHNRVLFVENWGAVAVGVLMFWTAFLPMGRRFSVDALLADLRARPDEATPAPPPAGPVVSLAVLAVLLQVAAIYWFNYAHKTGPTWKEGTAVHYVLWQERIVTPVGLWVRMHLPFGFTRALTTATLAIERSAAFLILTPLFWRWTRALAILLLAGLHVGIALLANFGVFSVAMLAYLPLLLDESHWRVLSALVPMRGRRRQVFYDAGCGVCFQIVRVLARMDVHRRLTWISNQDRAALPEGVDTALLERTMLVVDPHTGRRWTRSDGFAQVFAALPFGRLWAWVLLVPGLRALAGRAYDAFARNRTVLSTQLGLAACGVPAAAPSAAAPPASPRTPLGDWARARLPFLREAALAVGLVVAWADLSVTNPAVPEALRWRGRPEWMATAVMYPHLSEAWSMFSPDAPRSDQMILIDAVTREGRHVDPYNEAASRVAEVPLGDIPPRLGQDSLFCDYTLRIPDSAPYFQALIEWVLRYHERTGRPRDQVLRFQAWVIEHDSPPPGERRRNSPVRLHKFVEWPIPGEGR